MRSLLCLFSLFILSGCVQTLGVTGENTVFGTWRLYDVEPLTERSGGHSFSETASLKQIVKDGIVLCFFEDGKYTEIKGKGEYKAGSYQFSDKKGALKFIDEGKAASSMETQMEGNKNGKQILTMRNEQRNVVLKFIKEAETGEDFRDAPFYADNNLWRIKPKGPENTLQQTNRLTNYLKHVALILKAAKESKQSIFSVEFSQGPIKIYYRGIGIHPYEIVPESWKACFYNEAEAYAAYRKYEHYLQTTSYKGGGTGDWVEDDYNILLSIYAGLQESQSKHKL